MMAEKMRQRRSHSVPMDVDGMSPDSLKAAFVVAVETLSERTERAGELLDWSSFQMSVHLPAVKHDVPSDSCALMVVRAGVLS